jgi:uncharacterized protein|tara:strand:- start:3123 stop:3668 length:546 start_codon:yes stop_codon:yes gene_type:complete
MLSASQANILPQFVDPRQLVKQGATLTGQVNPDLCGRLAEAVIRISEPITSSLVFHVEDGGRKAVHVKSSTTVLVNCHRCLGAMSLPLQCDTIIGIVWTEDEANTLPKELDFWIVAEKGDIAELLEDELLLALPFVIYHDEDSCGVSLGSLSSEKTFNEKIDSSKNPFEVLRELKDSIFDK